MRAVWLLLLLLLMLVEFKGSHRGAAPCDSYWGVCPTISLECTIFDFMLCNMGFLVRPSAFSLVERLVGHETLRMRGVDPACQAGDDKGSMRRTLPGPCCQPVWERFDLTRWPLSLMLKRLD